MISARIWLLCPSDYERTRDFGIAADRVFPFADWVGGRLSVWGPIGLAIIIAIGAKRFPRFSGWSGADGRAFSIGGVSG